MILCQETYYCIYITLCTSQSSLPVPCPPVRAFDSSTGIHQDISFCGPTVTHSIFFNHWVGRSIGTNQCCNPLEFWTFWVYISTWNEPLFPLRTLSYQLSPTSYPVCLLHQSCLLRKFHPSSAGCHISPRSYTTAVFTSGFSSSGSKPSGLNISNHGILQSSWMRTSSHTFAGFKDKMWWQVFCYIFRNPAFTDASLKGKTFSWEEGKTSQLERPSDSRPMVSSGIPTSYQLAGTGSHPTCVTSFGTSVAKSVGESLLRQQYRSSVHLQTGRNTFSVPVSQNSGTVRSPGSVCDNSSSYTSSRSQECYGRCSVPNQSTQPNRMAHPKRNLEQSVLCLRNSPDRHVCHSGEQGHARLCFSLLGRQSMGGRRPVPILGRFRTSLCVSSGSHCPQNSPENPKISGHHGHHDCFTLPSRPWHPLLLQLSTRPRIPLPDVNLFQYVPNLRRPQYHWDPRLLDLAAWKLSGTSWIATISPTRS